MKIPQALGRYFADSTLRFLSFDADSGEASLSIEKEIGPESGIIRVFGASYVSLPDCFAGDGIDAVPVADLTESFWNQTPCHRDLVEHDQTVFQFFDQDGAMHFLVADSITYDIVTNS